MAMLRQGMGLLLAGIVLWLAGCATPLATQGPPLPIVTVEHCVAASDIPPPVPRLTDPKKTDLQNAAALDLERRKLRQYQEESAALLVRCSQ
jgi:hypothetical protein